MIISLIAAMSENRVIGVNNRLPWNIPEDLKHFRRITEGHPVIMGRKTYESIGRLLPNRKNIIVTRKPDFRVPGAEIVHGLEDAFAQAGIPETSDDEVFVIGGAEIYAQALPRARRIYLTLVHKQVNGDVHFPSFANSEFVEISRDDRTEPIAFSFILLERSSKIR